MSVGMQPLAELSSFFNLIHRYVNIPIFSRPNSYQSDIIYLTLKHNIFIMQTHVHDDSVIGIQIAPLSGTTGLLYIDRR